LISTAYAQTGGGGGDFLIQIFPFILIFAIIYFLIIRPQQKRVKDHKLMIGGVRRGDTVVTSGGIVGKVTRVFDDSDEILVEIADGVRVKVVRGTLSDVRSKSEPVPAAGEKPKKDS
jgi:preprotein translocase subunit YajC